MALDVDAVIAYTDGRLEDNDETARMLDAALDAARRYCGWHVTPEQDDDVTLDGPGGPVLWLPTLRLITLSALTEDGENVDIDDLYISPLGQVAKQPVTNWTGYGSAGTYWTSCLGGITATMTHGFDEAPSFDAAVLSYVNRSSMSIANAGGTLTAVGPFVYGATALAQYSAFTSEECMILNMYRLERAP